jgi:GTP pyrophosphokinase
LEDEQASEEKETFACSPTKGQKCVMEIETASDSQQIIAHILGDQKQFYNEGDLQVLCRAYEFAAQAHAGQFRASGEPYITHCVETARILAGMTRDPLSIAATLLHDTIEDCNRSKDEIAANFGDTVAALVDGVTKISSLKLQGTREEKVESFRKLILAMARDLRVIIIKLADRIHNLRTIQYLPPEKQKRIAQETLDLYAPLAGRLGMSRVKAELEDLSMKVLYPAEFQQLSQQLKALRARYEYVIQKVINTIRVELAAHQIRADIEERFKHIYSIWKKMQRQGIGLDSIYDVMAVRVICDGDNNVCYTVLGIIHALWPFIPGRWRDFIASPKENGYRSIHTTVLGPDNQRIEIQIRTREMHKVAEEGVASHWKYKEGVRGRSDLEEKLTWLRRLVDWIKDAKETGDQRELLDSLKADLSSETIFCFTPKGDVIELPVGATALDFAYYVHTSVGETCTGAVVNNRLVPLRYELKTGDVVEIRTSPKAHPSRDWLDIVKTPRARTKVKHWLRTQRLSPENIQKGKEALAGVLRGRNLPIDWEELEQRLKPVLKNYHVQSFDELCAEIGFGGILASTVVAKAYPEVSSSQPSKLKSLRGASRRPVGVVVGSLTNAMVRFAACCSPVPGDPIVGFVTVGRGVTIHSETCKHVQRLKESDEMRQRLLPAQWDIANLPIREVGLRIECNDRKGLLADVSSAITSSNVFILGSRTKSKGDTAILNFTVQVKNRDELVRLFSILKTVKGVVRITRTGAAHDNS